MRVFLPQLAVLCWCVACAFKCSQAPPLVWDDALAASAASWASGCPNGHSGYAGVGENMACEYHNQIILLACCAYLLLAGGRSMGVACMFCMEPHSSPAEGTFP